MKNALANLENHAKGQRETESPVKPQESQHETMHAIVWKGSKSVEWAEVPKPELSDPRDVLIMITATTICGSDLHLYSGNIPTMEEGDILGHEFMGYVTEVGGQVTKVKKYDRVVVAFNIACGTCDWCKRKEFSGCQVTNPSILQKDTYGQRTCAIFGYSHLTGGVPGGQSEYVRVPFADTNCLVLPSSIPDEVGLFLSDVIPTAYWGTEMAEVKKGDVVGVWGLGPVGLLVCKWALIRGAKMVVGIDCVKERLAIAENKLGIKTINFKEQNPVEVLNNWFPTGIDCGIECSGFEYPSTFRHKIEMALGMESDTADILTEIITSVRCFGKVSILGVYIGECNHFPIGAVMEKGLTLRGGQSPTQRYWDVCLDFIKSGAMDPSFIVTTRGTLKDAPELYEKFYKHEEGIVKVFLRPDPEDMTTKAEVAGH